MKRYGPFVAIAFAGVILQMTLLPRLLGLGLRPDIAFLVVIFLGLNRSSGEATLPVVITGYLTDLFSGLPMGTFLLVYLLCFYAAGFLVKVLYFRGELFPLVTTLVLSLVYVGLLSLLTLLGQGRSPAEAGITLSSAVAFGGINFLCGIVVFRLCARIESRLNKHTGGYGTLKNVLPGD